MIKLKHIFVFLVFLSSSCFAQPTFNNIDSLLSKNYQTVNNRDSVSYLSIINQSFIFKDKNLKSKSDSLIILKPFTDAYRDLIDELTEMTSSTNFTVKYIGYEFRNKSMKITHSGSLPIHVQLLVNNTFTIKMPIAVYTEDGRFSIISPMTVMFLEEK